MVDRRYSRDMVMPLFTADTHFYHRSINKFCPTTRKGSNSGEMTEILIANWNEQVAPDDEVYHLGDVSFGPTVETAEVLKRLNGKIHLIVGNHDKELQMRQFKRFESINRYVEIKILDTYYILFHYPIHEWNHIHRGSYHLYGHVHGRELALPNGRSLDVGIDNRPLGDMKLWTVPEIEAYMQNQPIRNHHA